MIEQNYEKLENQVFDYEILKQHPKSKFFTQREVHSETASVFKNQ